MIWVECHPDKKLVEVLGFRGRHPKGGGKGRVVERVSRRGGVGLVDLDYEGTIPSTCREDPVHSLPEHGIRVFRCGRGWTVALERNLEEFLLASARESGIDVESYGLSRDVREMHHQMSRMHQPWRFVEFGDLSNVSSRLTTLANLLRELEGHEGS